MTEAPRCSEFFCTPLVPATANAHPEQSARLLGTISGGVPRVDAAHRAEEARDFENARVRLEFGLDTLRLLGATADGLVGIPIQTRRCPRCSSAGSSMRWLCSRCLKGISRWLHLDLPHQEERKFHVPVTVVTTA